MERRSLDITYSSDVMISDSEELASLAIFYDRVFLPAATADSTRNFIEFERFQDGVLRISASEISGLDVETPQGSVQMEELVIRWEHQNRDLFVERVLIRLPEPQEPADRLKEWLERGQTISMSFGDLVRYRGALPGPGGPDSRFVYIRQDHLRHLLRSDLVGPAVFAGPNESQREVLKALQALHTFRYLVPCVGTLPPEEILTLREKLSDTREGFAMHLQTLSADVEARIAGGEDINDLSRYAQAVIETKLIPDYYEFKRQLSAERSGFWLKVIEATRKVFEVEVPPWTPKFYGEVLAALGVSFLVSTEARRESLSNRSQAFQFMHKIDEAVADVRRSAG
jgi:hypothetical protein